MSHTPFIMPSEEEIQRLKRKYTNINLVEILHGSVCYKAITRTVSKNVIKGLDCDSNAVFRAVWDRVKLVYDSEFDTNEILMIEAIKTLTKE